MRLSLGLLLIGVFALSCLSTSIFKPQDQALAQQYIQTIKHRNLVIDFGNGVKTNAQLTLPAPVLNSNLPFDISCNVVACLASSAMFLY